MVSQRGGNALERTSEEINVRPFESKDQKAARQLILEGLGEHFGFIDEQINHDLDDITAYYATSLFLVAVSDGRILGTGALVEAAEGVAQVVRMSTDHEYRRRGIAKVILAQLLDHARSVGYRRIVLGTNDSWEDAIGFYKASGFAEAGRAPGGIFFVMDL